MPRVKSEGEFRKSRRSSHSAQDVNGRDSPHFNKEDSIVEEPHAPRKLGSKKSMFEEENNEASDASMSYLEKRRAERAYVYVNCHHSSVTHFWVQLT